MAINIMWAVYLGIAFYLALGILLLTTGYMIFRLARYLKNRSAARRKNRNYRILRKNLYHHSPPLRL